MISFNSLKKFIYINGLLFFIGTFEYNMNIITCKNTYFNFFTMFLTFSSRNFYLINLFDNNLQNKEYINNNIITENYKNEFKINLYKSTIIETFTFIFIQSFILNNSSINYI